MIFELGDEQKNIQAMIRSFGEKSILPVIEDYEKREEFPWDIVKEMAALGLFGAPFPEQYGGAGMDYLSYAVIMEELGRLSSSIRSIVSAHCGLVSSAIYEDGTEEQRKEFLPPLARGEKLGCYCLTEPEAGSDAGSVRTKAERKGESWVISGQKTFITNATVAGIALIFARTEQNPGARGITAFLADMNSPGITRNQLHGKLGLKASDTGDVFFEDLQIPESAILGERAHGFRVAMKALDKGRLGLAAGCVGIAQRALDLSIAYAREREQFGRPIGTFQLIQEHIAQTAIEVEAARLLTYKAAVKKMSGERNTKEVCMAKLYASEVAIRAAQRAIQVHGGYGYFEEFGVERLLRDAQVATLYEGSSEIQKLIIGNILLDLKAFT